MPRASKQNPEEDAAPLVHDTLAEMGRLVPQTEDDAAAAEQRLRDSPIELPESLRDADAVLRRTEGSPPSPVPFPGNADVEATLARAAREGGAIPPEIEQIMRRDREAAEAELDDETEDQ